PPAAPAAPTPPAIPMNFRRDNMAIVAYPMRTSGDARAKVSAPTPGRTPQVPTFATALFVAGTNPLATLSNAATRSRSLLAAAANNGDAGAINSAASDASVALIAVGDAPSQAVMPGHPPTFGGLPGTC